tara:strand:- start:1795 stop:2940 length:1146 start_codon:yes stop_codon:yes gene_type:complete
MKKIVFLTGTRADFGKLKSLIKITQSNQKYEVHVFVTGMHLDKKYGETVREIEKSKIINIHKYNNCEGPQKMDRTLASTINGFSIFIANLKPDLIVVHGDRVEPLAGAIVGSLNNVLVAHVEGGEISGTIDELIRHAVSKLSHIHLVSNNEAKRRLVQMGELDSSIFIIGSPDFDLMKSNNLPSLDKVKAYYNITFDKYAIVMYHPVTTEFEFASERAEIVAKTLLKSNKNYIVIFPNNDLGCEEIFEAYEMLKNKENIKIFPSLRFEYFLRLLKESEFILGNSSAGISEAPYYNVPTINIGSRQNNRAVHDTIINVNFDKSLILSAINSIECNDNNVNVFKDLVFGNSDNQFLNLISADKFWRIDCQKQFQDFTTTKRNS